MSSTPPANSLQRALPVLYFILGQVAWFGCVISAARGVAWSGEALGVLLVVLHVVLSRSPWHELKLVASVAAIGFIWESVLVRSGLLSYPSSGTLFGLAPLWLPVLWAVFAAQLNLTYGWLKSRLWMAAVLGALAGPLSFRAGAALGALRFERPLQATLALAIGWAMLLPVAVTLARRWPREPAPDLRVL